MAADSSHSYFGPALAFHFCGECSALPSSFFHGACGSCVSFMRLTGGGIRPGAKGAKPVPTLLPERRVAAASQKTTLGTKILNTFMITTALVLTFIVLLTEERYALGPNYDQMVAAEQAVDQEKAP
jgi:hypothetical protein